MTIFIGYKVSNASSKRNNSIWYLYFANGIVFLLGLAVITFFDPQRKLTLLSWLVFDLIVSFSLTVELFGWLRLSKFDQATSESLVGLRTILIKMRYSSSEYLEKLKKATVTQKDVLKEEKLDSLIGDFIGECENLNEPLNPDLWALTLNETTERINDVNTRSKHPIPKLIDILALSGLSILIAELLKLLG
jgi:hypothetical protein